jgi:hypothetical protein
MKRSKRCKEIRRRIKEDKRIIILLYRKGELAFLDDIKDLYWEYYKHIGTSPKGKRRNYSRLMYLGEIYFSTTDYFSEEAEHGVVDMHLEHKFWEELGEDWDGMNEIPKKIQRYTRKQLIRDLKLSPNVKYGSKEINYILRRTEE